ncbi:heme o synthase [Cytobacillus gottheilii]|uniref:Protoheme IX farnesyltransferase n=1 Tax=Cytobacillus gottheilii TaxID=859144 RepID=A0ABX8FGK4_9BACI|nr:heme o synthase [Cytobacillus gottheilii]QVY63152.1 heme o synthase [Cytobacillus gottheilii]
MANSRAFSEAGIEGNEGSLKNGLPSTTVWKDFMALIKVGIVNSNAITTFTGIWLALHFTGKGFFHNLDIVFFTLVGSSLIIAGSCSLNNYIDRDIDHLMERTKSRPTVTGKVKPVMVAIMSFAFISGGTLLLLLTTKTAVLIGLVGVFSYVVLYTLWTKRRFVSNTIVGSISGAVPPLIGWAAVDANLDPMAWVLFLIMFIWQPPHFYALAMRRAEEYRAAGVPMLPVVKGFKVTKIHTYVWIILLIPLPFLLPALGTPFIAFATLLNLGWIAVGVYANKFKDDIKWATLMFVYSIQYLTILFVAMVIVTLI